MNHVYNPKEQFKNTQNGTHMSDSKQESMTANPKDNISQMKRRVSNGQMDSIDSITLNRNIEKPSQESDAYT